MSENLIRGTSDVDDAVVGITTTSSKNAVGALNTSTGNAVFPGGNALFGVTTAVGGAGVFGANNSSQGVGVQGNGPQAGLSGFSEKGAGVLAHSNHSNAVEGFAHDPNGSAVLAINESTTAPTINDGTPRGCGVVGVTSVPDSAGIFGANNGDAGDGVQGITNSKVGPATAPGGLNDPAIRAGVWGNNSGSGYGVKGTSPAIGVFGSGSVGIAAVGREQGLFATGAVGVAGGGSQVGVKGDASSTTGAGVGVDGRSAGLGPGTDPAMTAALSFETSAIQSGGVGVFGIGTRVGVQGVSPNGHGVDALSVTGIGVAGASNGTGPNAIGVFGRADSSHGGFAGKFSGNVDVAGNLSKSGGGFKIDHPLAPKARHLNHSFVESPERKNIYDGVVVLDFGGEAVVELPSWFQAINTGFRYQLTCIGEFAAVYIARKLADNRFTIAGGRPGMEVSWQVTGVRSDKWALANPLPVEEDKHETEVGLYRHPEVYAAEATQILAGTLSQEALTATVP